MENITKPMEQALLKELGPGIPHATVSTFRGTTCFFHGSVNYKVPFSTYDRYLFGIGICMGLNSL
jgi:hypothetical protein